LGDQWTEPIEIDGIALEIDLWKNVGFSGRQKVKN
jgi:hypothetical protein